MSLKENKNNKAYVVFRVVWVSMLAYLATVLLFGFIYSYFSDDLKKSGCMTALDPFYFSVVTMTSLGYGEITPTTMTTKLLVMTQVVIGLVSVGGFLTWLSLSLSNVNQKEMEKETRRYQELLETETRELQEQYAHQTKKYRDRLQFPSFVAVVHLLTTFVDKYASEHLRQAHKLDWNYYYFGKETLGIPPSRLEHNWLMGLGPEGQGEIRPEKTKGWDDDLFELSKNLKIHILDADPEIFDDEIIKQYEIIDLLLMTARQDLPNPNFPEVYGKPTKIILKRRCEILEGVISDLKIFRELFLIKANKVIGGQTSKYFEIHQRLPSSELPYMSDESWRKMDNG